MTLATLATSIRRRGVAVDRRWTYAFWVPDGKLLRQEGFDTLAEARTRIAGG